MKKIVPATRLALASLIIFMITVNSLASNECYNACPSHNYKCEETCSTGYNQINNAAVTTDCISQSGDDPMAICCCKAGVAAGTVCQTACSSAGGYACSSTCASGYSHTTTNTAAADANCGSGSMCCCKSTTPATGTVCQTSCTGSASYACENPCRTGFAHTTTNTAADADCGTSKMCCCESTVTGAGAKCTAACASAGGGGCQTNTCAPGSVKSTDAAANTDCGTGSVCCCKSTTTPTGTTATTSSGTTATTADAGGSGGYVKATCQCTCGKDKTGAVRQIGATGLYKPGFLDFSGTSSAETKCQAQCGRTCGGFTSCPTDKIAKCSDCCDDYCTNEFKAGTGAGTGGDDPVELCKAACRSTCDFRGTINGITDIIYTVAAIIGAIMLAIHGIRLVTSGDAGARESAKSSMAYVILALIIIALAGAAVRMFTNMGQNIEPAPPDTGGISATECAKGCSNAVAGICQAPSCHSVGGGGKCLLSNGQCIPCPSPPRCEDNAFIWCQDNPCKVPGGCQKDNFKGTCVGINPSPPTTTPPAVDCSTCSGVTCLPVNCDNLGGGGKCFYTKAGDCAACTTSTKCEDYGFTICTANVCKINLPKGCQKDLSPASSGCLTVT